MLTTEKRTVDGRRYICAALQDLFEKFEIGALELAALFRLFIQFAVEGAPAVVRGEPLSHGARIAVLDRHIGGEISVRRMVRTAPRNAENHANGEQNTEK